jgi:hypothetical protein
LRRPGLWGSIIEFIEDGNGINRQQIVWNDFIIVAPRDDPAHIAGGHDAKTALIAIAKAHATFVSRGDKSGTNALELRQFSRKRRSTLLAGSDRHHCHDIGGQRTAEKVAERRGDNATRTGKIENVINCIQMVEMGERLGELHKRLADAQPAPPA